MRALCAAALAFAGCAHDAPDPAVPPDAAADAAVDARPFAPAATCEGSPLALYGMDGSNPATIVGPVTVDTTGTTICLSLDARDNIWIAHFAAGTVYQTAADSSFELALFAADGTQLQTGWDVAFGSSPTTVFANLEYGVTVGQVLDVRLVVRAKAGSATTQVALHLFEPYE